MKKQGQAVVELAIFGTLILFAFNVLLMYGQNMNQSQEIKMEAFRKAMQKAYYKNSSISYTLKKDKRNADLFSGFGQSSAIGSSASVMWTKGAPGGQGADDEQSFSFYQVNDNVLKLDRRTKTIKNYSGEDQEVTAPVSIWKEEVKKKTTYSSEAGKAEGGSGITNSRNSAMQEDVEVKLYTRFDDAEYDSSKDYDDQPLPKYEYDAGSQNAEFGAYLDTDGTIKYREGETDPVEKGRKWVTPN